MVWPRRDHKCQKRSGGQKWQMPEVDRALQESGLGEDKWQGLKNAQVKQLMQKEIQIRDKLGKGLKKLFDSTI